MIGGLLNVEDLATLVVIDRSALLLLCLDIGIVLLLSESLSRLRHFINYYLFQNV